MKDHTISFSEYEDHLKSLVDEGKYTEALEYCYAHLSKVSHPVGDVCSTYSYRIFGVCRYMHTKGIWEKDGYHFSPWVEIGNRHFEGGNYKGAISAYEKATLENREDAFAWYAMGCAYRALGNPYESVEAWDEAVSIVRGKRGEE